MFAHHKRLQYTVRVSEPNPGLERLVSLTDDPGVKEALGFLMTREIAHQKSFEKALYAIEPNFPPGKLQGMPQFSSTYFNMSEGPGDLRGPWNQGPQWNFVENRDQQMAVGGGGGDASVNLPDRDLDTLRQMAMRTRSNPGVDPVTGAELGSGAQRAAAQAPVAGAMGTAGAAAAGAATPGGPASGTPGGGAGGPAGDQT